MNAEDHRRIARRIERSLAKLGAGDCEMKIEGAMLAGTHWVNAALHDMGVTPAASDLFHTYLLTVNEYRRLSVAGEMLVPALAEIEDLRPPFVRGDQPGGEQAAERALVLLAQIRGAAAEQA